MERVVRLQTLSRRILLPLALAPAVFLVAGFCMRFPYWTDGTSSLWLATGISLAALLRSRSREWPALIAASVAGTIAASLYVMHDAWPMALTRAGNNALEYCLCAWIVRRRCGDYFDLTDLRHLTWLAGSSTVATLLKVAAFAIAHLLRIGTSLSAGEVAGWAPMAVLGVFVIALPLLAMTSRRQDAFRLDHGILLLFALLAGEVWMCFGPPAIPIVFIILLVMMMIGWRYGLRGSGLGTIIVTVFSLGLSASDTGVINKLRALGYGAATRGSYMELFLIAATLSSLPLAILRARQAATDTSLAEALAAAELRAAALAMSEAAARRAVADALRSEAAAVRAREELGRVIETSIDVICTLDAEGRFLQVSENCLQLWGWRSEELIGRLWFDFIPEEDRAPSIEHYRLRKAGKLTAPVRKRHLRPDGTTVPMFWSLTWVPEDQACYGVGRDMSQQDELHERAAQAHRMDSIGQLTGGIAHDFNNLLTVILGNCQVLAVKLKDAKLQALASMSARAADHGAELVGQLLAFGRRQPLKPRRFDPAEMLRSAAPLIRRALDETITFTILPSEDVRPVLADPVQTETAILNLCINARDAMPKGGKLCVGAANVTVAEPDDRRLDLLPGDYVHIWIEDSGTGMTPEVVERIFEPFFTTKEVGKGSGLGLSMVYGFIRQSGGTVGVESELGTGTTVSLYLPVAPAEVPSTRREKTPGAIYMGSGTVLVVEDHELVRDHTRLQFVSLGYEVLTAENGAEALAMLGRRHDIDLVFTDVVMPGGMSGFDLGKIVRERWPSIRVMFTSGYTQDSIVDIDDALLLLKPYTLQTLSQKVHHVLTGPSLGATISIG